MGVVVRQKIKGKGNPWWVFISHNGKRTSRKIGDKRAANAVASEIRERLKLGDFKIDSDKRPIPTFKNYSEGFMQTYSTLNHKPATRESYEYVLNNHLLPEFGDRLLDEIKRTEVKKFIRTKLLEGYSRSTARIFLSYFSAILGEAVDDEIITDNTAKIPRKKVLGKKVRPEIKPLDASELNHLLETVREQMLKHYPLFLLLARTGLRIGEALALKWNDIDFNGRFIKVTRSVRKGVTSPPKSGKSRRIDMTPQLKRILLAHRTEVKKTGLKLGIGEIKLVFPNRQGGFIDTDNWRNQVFRRALKKAEMRRIRIHDLRHSYATLRLQAGHNIPDVSNQLGHHSVKITLDIYYHWIPGKQKEEVDTLDNLHLSAPQPHPEGIEGSDLSSEGSSTI